MSSDNKTSIGWVGLGAMGQAHVANLLANDDFNLVVWNRDGSKCASAVAAGALQAASAREVVERSAITFVMLSSPAAAMEVYTHEEGGILAGLTSGKGVVDCASLDAETMRKLGALVGARGGRFLAAPVAGHSGMAVAATCQSICAGDESLFRDATGALQKLSKNVVWLGDDVGAASNTKLVINVGWLVRPKNKCATPCFDCCYNIWNRPLLPRNAVYLLTSSNQPTNQPTNAHASLTNASAT